ncbi:Tim44 domain-containing protein [Neorhizobium alkalisoli]|uniref:Tim44 domain-containing protein n=1 Tax=Neorhizobium alkalisoli TaxID=528178 RepID=UPI000CF8CAAD|nr:Tim44 domain-containing protein [Neorhizobium alkalisoli]
MLSKLRRFQKLFAILAVGMAVSLTAVDMAEARRAGGGGFGSRGTRTYSAPATTNTAPAAPTGINRSMTPNTQQNATTPQSGFGQQAAQQPRRGLFGGMAGGLLGGLALGGLLGMMMGTGFGGMAGFFGMLLQIALIAGLAMLAFRFFGRRQQQPAGPAGNYGQQRNAYEPPQQNNASGFQIPKIGSLGGGAAAGGYAAAPRQAGPETDEIGITNRDLDQFEKLLTQVQSAYAAEDYAKLRNLTTPEAMSYLAEELGENATNGLKNEVQDVKLLQGDLAEAWRENGQDYATVAMRYSSVDFMRDRNTGAVAEGDPGKVTETVEVWTFVRKPANDWKLSAIQAAA